MFQTGVYASACCCSPTSSAAIMIAAPLKYGTTKKLLGIVRRLHMMENMPTLLKVQWRV